MTPSVLTARNANGARGGKWWSVDDAGSRRLLDFFGRGGDRGAREKRCEGDHACDGACVSRGVASAAAQSGSQWALTFETAFARGLG